MIWAKALPRWGASLAAAAVALTAVFLRQEGVPKAFTIWAEDGQVFANCAFRDPTQLTCLGEVYGGYFHTVPRLGAALASVLPPVLLPVWLTLAAAIVTAACAALVARVVVDLSGSRVSGVLAGASLALTYHAGREVGGNLANLHWILLVAAVVVLVAGWIGRRPQAADIGLVAAAAFSSAFAPLLVGLAVPALLRRQPGSRPVFALTALATVMQVGASVAHPRNEPVQRMIDGSAFAEYAWSQIVGRGAFGGHAFPLDAAVWFGLVVVGAVLASLAFRSRAPEVAAKRALAAVVALTAIGLAIATASVVLNNFLGPRYAYVPATLAVIALVLGSARASTLLIGDPRLPFVARTLGRGLTALVSVGLIAGFALSFRLEARASGGPDVLAEYRAASAACRAGEDQIRLVTAPDPASGRWSVTVPCDRVR